MRLALFAIVSWSAVVSAQPRPQPPPAAPPSKTFERAIKLRDKKDYYSASIELHKVVSGETGDPPPIVQRARLELALDLFLMDYTAASVAMLSEIVQAGPAHAGHAQAVKWIVELAEKPDLHAAEALPPHRDALEAAAAALAEPARSALYYRLGAAIAAAGEAQAQVQVGDARRLLAQVAPGSPHHARALLELARLAPRAELPAGAREALGQLAAASPSAAFTASRIDLELAGTVPALVDAPIAAFEAAIVAASCARGPTADVRPQVAVTVRSTREAIGELLAAAAGDDARVYEGVERFLQGGPAPPADRSPVLAIRVALAGTRALAAWTAELERELQLFERSDLAWRVTPIGAAVVQELTVQHETARAELGRRYRDRLEAMGRDLDAVAQVVSGAPVAIAAGPAAPPGRGLLVSAEACTAAHGSQPGGRAGGAPRGLGCAGCTSPGAPAPALALAWLLIAAARRGRARARRRRAASPPCSARAPSS